MKNDYKYHFTPGETLRREIRQLESLFDELEEAVDLSASQKESGFYKAKKKIEYVVGLYMQLSDDIDFASAMNKRVEERISVLIAGLKT